MRVPSAWRALSPDSLSPLRVWLDELGRSRSMLLMWSRAAAEKLPPVWLGGLSFPRALLRIFRHIEAYRLGIPVGGCVLHYRVRVNADEENSLHLTGLYAEGFEWDADGDCMKVPSHYPRPHFGAIVPDIFVSSASALGSSPLLDRSRGSFPRDPSHLSNATDVQSNSCAAFECPVYSTSQRKGDPLARIPLATGEGTKNEWLVRGAALILSPTWLLDPT
jgi:hypothetical protein